MTARTYARVPVTIGDDFTAADLSPHARLTWMILCAQVKLQPCGLLELRERVWARDAGLDLGELDAAMNELDDAGWVAIDWDTYELVVPRHVRDDIQVSNYKIVRGVWASIDRIESPRLRQVALDRIAQIPGFPPDSRNPQPQVETQGESSPAPDQPTVPPPGGSPDRLAEASAETSAIGFTRHPEARIPSPPSSVPRTGYTGGADPPVDNLDGPTTTSQAPPDRHDVELDDRARRLALIAQAVAQRRLRAQRQPPDRPERWCHAVAQNLHTDDDGAWWSHLEQLVAGHRDDTPIDLLAAAADGHPSHHLAAWRARAEDVA